MRAQNGMSAHVSTFSRPNSSMSTMVWIICAYIDPLRSPSWRRQSRRMRMIRRLMFGSLQLRATSYNGPMTPISSVKHGRVISDWKALVSAALTIALYKGTNESCKTARSSVVNDDTSSARTYVDTRSLRICSDLDAAVSRGDAPRVSCCMQEFKADNARSA